MVIIWILDEFTTNVGLVTPKVSVVISLLMLNLYLFLLLDSQ